MRRKSEVKNISLFLLTGAPPSDIFITQESYKYITWRSYIMKNKPINLSVWMFSKVIPAALLFLYYGMCSWDGYDPTLRYLQAVSLVLAGVIVLWQVSYAKKKKLFDEFARENLKTTDSICLKIAYVLMVIAVLACVFADFSGIIAGYFVVGGILLLTILRAVIFAVIDKKGM